jgi:hypothetical protein
MKKLLLLIPHTAIERIVVRRIQTRGPLVPAGRETSQFQQRRRRFVAAFGIAPTLNENEAKRWTAGIRINDGRFRSLRERTSTTLPYDRAFRYGFVRFEHVQNQHELMMDSRTQS